MDLPTFDAFSSEKKRVMDLPTDKSLSTDACLVDSILLRVTALCAGCTDVSHLCSQHTLSWVLDSAFGGVS